MISWCPAMAGAHGRHARSGAEGMRGCARGVVAALSPVLVDGRIALHPLAPPLRPDRRRRAGVVEQRAVAPALSTATSSVAVAAGEHCADHRQRLRAAVPAAPDQLQRWSAGAAAASGPALCTRLLSSKLTDTRLKSWFARPPAGALPSGDLRPLSKVIVPGRRHVLVQQAVNDHTAAVDPGSVCQPSMAVGRALAEKPREGRRRAPPDYVLVCVA